MITAKYDRHSDVLYIALDEPRPAVAEEGAEGLVYRFGMSDDRPCGVTVLSYRTLWTGRDAELAERIAAFLRTRTEDVRAAISSEAIH
jgi:Protein of unknown function (DUF2283)